MRLRGGWWTVAHRLLQLRRRRVRRRQLTRKNGPNAGDILGKWQDRCTTVILRSCPLPPRPAPRDLCGWRDKWGVFARHVPRRSPCVMTPATRRMLAAAGHPVVAFSVTAHRPRHQGQHMAQLHPVDCAGPSSAVCFSDSAASLATTPSLAGLRFASPSGWRSPVLPAPTAVAATAGNGFAR